MSNSGSAITDALVTLLSGSNAFGAGAVTYGTYDVLEQASGCCAIVHPPRVQSTHDTYGTWGRTWIFPIDTFYAEEADVTLTLARLSDGQAAILDTFEADDTILGTVSKVDEIDISDNNGVALELGGRVWLPCPVRLRLTELT